MLSEGNLCPRSAVPIWQKRVGYRRATLLLPLLRAMAIDVYIAISHWERKTSTIMRVAAVAFLAQLVLRSCPTPAPR